MERIGIIDMGSNSVRLIIMDIGSEGEYHQMDNVKETVRLVENVGPDGSLDPIVQEHALDPSLQGCAKYGKLMRL